MEEDHRDRGTFLFNSLVDDEELPPPPPEWFETEYEANHDHSSSPPKLTRPHRDNLPVHIVQSGRGGGEIDMVM